MNVFTIRSCLKFSVLLSRFYCVKSFETRKCKGDEVYTNACGCFYPPEMSGFASSLVRSVRTRRRGDFISPPYLRKSPWHQYNTIEYQLSVSKFPTQRPQHMHQSYFTEQQTAIQSDRGKPEGEQVFREKGITCFTTQLPKIKHCFPR